MSIDEITDIVNSYPRHYVRMIKANHALLQWVKAHSLIESDTLAAHIYSAMYQKTDLCPNNNTYKFKSISEGFVYCGRAGVCDCARNAVSAAVKYTKSKVTKSELATSNAKRVATSIQKHGVANNGQTKAALDAHTDFYQDQVKVSESTTKTKSTKLSRYGTENYNNIIKIAATNQSRYGSDNVMQNTEIATHSRLVRKQNYDPATVYERNYNKFVVMIAKKFNVTTTYAASDYVGIVARPEMDFSCLTCGFQFTKRFDYASPPCCNVCNPTTVNFQSNEELEVVSFIKDNYDGMVSQNSRNIISPFELDIYLPELHVAIEYCGLYWHSELSGNKKWKYHYNKWKMCQDKGIQLVTIFSDEWNDTPELVKNKLKSLMGVSFGKIAARKCQVSVIDRQQTHTFHNQNHLQGSPKRLPINIGLYYQSTLVAVGSFIKNKSHYELIRFSSNTRVQGGAGKIISFFKKQYPGYDIVSFSDNRWSDGQMYSALKFDHISDVPPMQSYVEGYMTRHHKLALSRKNLQFDNKFTEWEFLQSVGYDRIWDCGKRKWILPA